MVFSYGFSMVLGGLKRHYMDLYGTMNSIRKTPVNVDSQGFSLGEPGGIRTHDLLIRSQNL